MSNSEQDDPTNPGEMGVNPALSTSYTIKGGSKDGTLIEAGAGVWVTIKRVSDHVHGHEDPTAVRITKKCVRPDYADPDRVQCISECPAH